MTPDPALIHEAANDAMAHVGEHSDENDMIVAVVVLVVLASPGGDLYTHTHTTNVL